MRAALIAAVVAILVVGAFVIGEMNKDEPAGQFQQLGESVDEGVNDAGEAIQEGVNDAERAVEDATD